MQPQSDSRSLLYEVNLEADAAIEAPFDTWLRDHIADMLQFDGFRSAEILDADAAPPGRIRRIVQYRLRDRAAFDQSIEEFRGEIVRDIEVQVVHMLIMARFGVLA